MKILKRFFKDGFGLVQFVKTKRSGLIQNDYNKFSNPTRFRSDRIKPIFPLRYYAKTIFFYLTNLSCLRAVVIWAHLVQVSWKSIIYFKIRYTKAYQQVFLIFYSLFQILHLSTKIVPIHQYQNLLNLNCHKKDRTRKHGHIEWKIFLRLFYTKTSNDTFLIWRLFSYERTRIRDEFGSRTLTTRSEIWYLSASVS